MEQPVRFWGCSGYDPDLIDLHGFFIRGVCVSMTNPLNGGNDPDYDPDPDLDN